jgi:carbon storage regulator
VIIIPRKKNESVVISDDIILTIIEIRRDKVRLGVELPEGATIFRCEVFEGIGGQKEGGRDQ